jgi:hypothetical protein
MFSTVLMVLSIFEQELIIEKAFNGLYAKQYVSLYSDFGLLMYFFGNNLEKITNSAIKQNILGSLIKEEEKEKKRTERAICILKDEMLELEKKKEKQETPKGKNKKPKETEIRAKSKEEVKEEVSQKEKPKEKKEKQTKKIYLLKNNRKSNGGRLRTTWKIKDIKKLS